MNSQLINGIVLIASIILCFILIILYYNYYQPYFFPNLTQNKDINKIIKTNNTYDQELLLIKGILPIEHRAPIIYSTSNKRSSNYVRFFESINKKGGNQFTYSFWINKKQNDYKNKVLFYRGNHSKESPKVQFGDASNELKIWYEVNDSKTGKILKKYSTIKNKLFDITDHNTWFLITIIFKDNLDYTNNNHENGIELSVYLNDTLLALHKEKDVTLRITNKDFVILPQASNFQTINTNVSGEIADLRYFNYALDYSQIKKLHQKGFNNEVFKTYLQLNKNYNKQTIHNISLFNQLRT
jgi:hypothetical protein